MYNVVRRFLRSRLSARYHISVMSIMAVCAIACSLMSCDSEAKRQKAAAEALVAEAETLLQQNRYEEAFVIMDSVDNAYPKQIEERRIATKMRSKAMGDYAELQIYQADSIIAELNDKVELEAKRYQHISGGDIPGYYVMTKMSRDNFLASSGFEGRIEDGTYRFYIVAINSDNPAIGIRQIAVASKDDSAYTEAIPAGSERAGETGPGAIDLANIEQSEAAPMLAWLENHVEEVDHALLIGNNDKKISYKPEQAKALVETWQFAQMASQLFQAKLQREKAERQLIIARDHSVNLE